LVIDSVPHRTPRRPCTPTSRPGPLFGKIDLAAIVAGGVRISPGDVLSHPPLTPAKSRRLAVTTRATTGLAIRVLL
jgi:hypothetical protein